MTNRFGLGAALGAVIVLTAAAPALAQGWEPDPPPTLGKLLVRALEDGGVLGSLGLLCAASASFVAVVMAALRLSRVLFTVPAVALGAAALCALAAYGLGRVGVENMLVKLGPAVTPKDIAAGNQACLGAALTVSLAALPGIAFTAFGLARGFPPRRSREDAA